MLASFSYFLSFYAMYALSSVHWTRYAFIVTDRLILQIVLRDLNSVEDISGEKSCLENKMKILLKRKEPAKRSLKDPLATSFPGSRQSWVSLTQEREGRGRKKRELGNEVVTLASRPQARTGFLTQGLHSWVRVQG